MCSNLASQTAQLDSVTATMLAMAVLARRVKKYYREFPDEINAALYSSLRLSSDTPLHHTHCLSMYLTWDSETPDPTMNLRFTAAKLHTFQEVEEHFCGPRGIWGLNSGD